MFDATALCVMCATGVHLLCWMGASSSQVTFFYVCVFFLEICTYVMEPSTVVIN